LPLRKRQGKLIHNNKPSAFKDVRQIQEVMGVPKQVFFGSDEDKAMRTTLFSRVGTLDAKMNLKD
jgi:hypothetical protein